VRLIGKVDARVFLALGFIIVGIGTSTQAWVTTSDAGFWTFAIPLALTGAGSAMLFIPLSIAILGATTPAEGPKASAFINLSTQLGGSIAVAGLSAYLDQRQSIHADALRTNATLSNVPTQEFLKTNPLTALSDLVNGQALILAYSDATMVIAVVAFVGVPFVLLMRKTRLERERLLTKRQVVVQQSQDRTRSVERPATLTANEARALVSGRNVVHRLPLGVNDGEERGREEVAFTFERAALDTEPIQRPNRGERIVTLRYVSA
jgi:MFS family permease